MSRRARSEELGETKIRKLKSVDRLHPPRRGGKAQNHPASMQSIIEVRLWNLMQDYLLGPRAHKSIKPLQMPDNLQDLWPHEDEMLEDMDLQITSWPASTESQRMEGGYVSSEATLEEMLDDAADDDVVPNFDCLNDEPSSEMMLDDDFEPIFDCLDDEPSGEMMLDDDLIPSFDCLDDEQSSEMMLDDDHVEFGALSSEGSFEDLMAMPFDSRRTIPIFNGNAADSWWEPGEMPVHEEGLGSQALTSRTDSEEELDRVFSTPSSEEMLDSSFSTVENEACAFSDHFDDEEQLSPGRLLSDDEDDLLDP